MPVRSSKIYLVALSAGLLFTAVMTIAPPKIHAQTQPGSAAPSAEDAALIRNGSRPAQSTTLPGPRSCNKWETPRSRGPSVRIGNLCRSMKSLSGIKTRSSASSFTGRPFLCLRMGMSGIRRNMYQPGSDENKHQVATYGPLTKFGYKDFIPMFKARALRCTRLGRSLSTIGRQICCARLRTS